MKVAIGLKPPAAKDWRIGWKTPWSNDDSLLLLKLMVDPLAKFTANCELNE